MKSKKKARKPASSGRKTARRTSTKPVISARLSGQMATMCAATLDLLDHRRAQGDLTDPAVTEKLRELVVSLHAAAGAADGSRLETLPPALHGTVRHHLDAISVRDEIVRQVEARAVPAKTE